ncbi:hypothetical protein U0070_017013, partial [Myodes glareolus]
MVAEVFILWCKSHNFKREEQNFVIQNEINNLAFLTGDSKSKMSKSGGQDQERKKTKRRGDLYSIQTSLIVAALKKMLPIGLNMCTPGDQELISLAKSRYSCRDTDEEVKEHLRNNLHLQEKVTASSPRLPCDRCLQDPSAVFVSLTVKLESCYVAQASLKVETF